MLFSYRQEDSGVNFNFNTEHKKIIRVQKKIHNRTGQNTAQD